jgi:hypothetical protein
MFFECRVLDKDGKIKKIISAEEVKKRHWEKIDATCDIVDWEEIDGRMKEIEEMDKTRFFICPTCGDSDRTNRDTKIYCSPRCQEIAKTLRRREKLQRKFP